MLDRDRMSAKGRSRARIGPEARSAEGSPVSAKGRSRARIGPEARSAEGSPVSAHPTGARKP